MITHVIMSEKCLVKVKWPVKFSDSHLISDISFKIQTNGNLIEQEYNTWTPDRNVFLHMPGKHTNIVMEKFMWLLIFWWNQTHYRSNLSCDGKIVKKVPGHTYESQSALELLNMSHWIQLQLPKYAEICKHVVIYSIIVGSYTTITLYWARWRLK